MGGGSSGKSEPLSRFHYNLLRMQQRLGVIFPLFATGPWPTYSWTRTKQGELNLSIEGRGTLHDPSGALDEAKRQFSTLDLKETLLISYFGVGLGYFYLAARDWLEESSQRYLLFLDDDVGAWRFFLETELASEIVDNPQVHLCPLLSAPPWFDQLPEIVDYFNCLPTETLFLPHYGEVRPNTCHQFAFDFATHMEIHSLLARQELTVHRGTYHNFYNNISGLADDLRCDRLYDKFEGVPAIVCGAGPSLISSLPHLKELTDRALIVGAGSALTALTQNEFEPHFGSGLCPDSLEAHRFWHAIGYEVPFVYRSRIDAAALSYIHGHHIYSIGCEGVWRVAAWLEEGLGISADRSLAAGPSVFFFTCEWLRLLGCNPILFVGLDLALSSKGEGYTPGVLHGPEELLSPEFEEIEQIDIYGNPITTYYKWVCESRSLGQLVSSHPEVTYLNATGGGIGVPGVENIDLEEAKERLLHRRYDLEGRLHSELGGATHPRISREEIAKQLGRLAQSMERCVELLDQLGVELQKVEKGVVSLALGSLFSIEQLGSATPPPWMLNGRIALLTSELEEEIAYPLILQPMLDSKAQYQKRIYDQFGFNSPKAIPVQWRRSLSILQEKNLALRREARLHLEQIKEGIAKNAPPTP